MPLFGPPHVDKLGAKRDVKGLTRALGYRKDPAVRRAAAVVLGQIGDPHAVVPLIAALDDQDRLAREGAAAALVKMGAAAVEALIAALVDQRLDDRSAAAAVLGQIGDVRAVEPLIAVLRDRNENVRRAAATALGRIGDVRAVEPLIAVIEADKGNYGYVCIEAARALGQIGDARAVAPLIDALKAGLKHVSVNSAAALGQLGDPRAVEPLIAALSDGRDDVRRASAASLDRLAWSPDRGKAGAAYWAARGEWGRCIQIGASAVAPLVFALTCDREDMRQAAARALGAIGDPRAVEPLIAALRDRSVGVGRFAAMALVDMYGSGKLDDARKAKVLAQRDFITETHSDEGAGEGRGGTYAGEDRSIGVEFPI